jgi:hypothetical protein
MTVASLEMTAPRVWARIAGTCWLISIVGGTFAEALVRTKLIAPDAATTIQNILVNERVYRLGLVAEFLGTATYLALTVLLYWLLAPMNRTTSSIAAFFGAAGCTMGMVKVVIDAVPLVFFAGSHAAFAVVDQMQSFSFGLLRLDPETLILGMICFGVQCFLVGYLVVRSTFLPKSLGVILMVGGSGYLVAGFTHMLSPPLAAQIGRYTLLPGEAAEMLMALWLTLFGINTAKWQQAIGAAELAQ